MSDQEQTNPKPPEFDFDGFPEGTLFFDRREGQDRRDRPRAEGPRPTQAPGERRAKKERRRRIDPTTFEKQYTDDELEFMTAMQRFKVLSGKSFPTHREVLSVAFSLGYRRVVIDDAETDAESDTLDAPDVVPVVTNLAVGF